MGYAVYHTEKGKGSGATFGNHIDRVKGKEKSYRNADPKKIDWNLNIPIYKNRHKLSLETAIQERIKEGYTKKRKIRKDAVRYLKHVFTGSHKDMKRIFKNKKAREKWIKENINFAEQEFGKENIVRVSLHLDERTPHLHVVSVPITEKGGISAKQLMGGSKEMELRQDRYAEKMKAFNLERGIRRTGIKHSDMKEYYGKIKKAKEDVAKEIDLEPVKGIFGINKNKTIEKHEEALDRAYFALKRAENYRNKNRVDVLVQENQKEKENFKKIILDQKLVEKHRISFLEETHKSRDTQPFKKAVKTQNKSLNQQKGSSLTM